MKSQGLAPRVETAHSVFCGVLKKLVSKIKSHGLMMSRDQNKCSPLVRGTLTMGDYTKKFQPSKWTDLVKSDDQFRAKILELMDVEVIQKFDNRQGNAADYYDEDDK